jgi:thiol-disulfide isomerase/thioredoxin
MRSPLSVVCAALAAFAVACQGDDASVAPATGSDASVGADATVGGSDAGHGGSSDASVSDASSVDGSTPSADGSDDASDATTGSSDAGDAGDATLPLDAGEGCDMAGYPAGPYGVTVGSTIANLDYSGWIAASTHASTDPLGPVCLGRYHGDPNVKALVLVGVAIWCPPCNEEEKSLVPLSTAYGGSAAFVDVLVNGQTVGFAATSTNLANWSKVYKVPYDVVLDPTFSFFDYFGGMPQPPPDAGDDAGEDAGDDGGDAGLTPAFPMHIVVRTDTMQIVSLDEGADLTNLQTQVNALVGDAAVPLDAGTD